MKYLFLIAMTFSACAPAYSAPIQRMADAQAAYRSAREAGAAEYPQAMLHLRLSEEQFAQGKTLLAQEENRRADFMFIRAVADAELALAMAQEQRTKVAAEEAITRARHQAEPQNPPAPTEEKQP